MLNIANLDAEVRGFRLELLLSISIMTTNFINIIGTTI